jgi:hypothetical protein
MKARYRPNDKIEFEIEGQAHTDLFGALAELDEVFGEPTCGNCESEDIYFRKRKVTAKEGKNKGKTFTYYEMLCRGCGHYLPYGQHREGGTLFPDRKINGEYDKKARGWRRWTGGDQEHDDE